jgi:hypothetical protein
MIDIEKIKAEHERALLERAALFEAAGIDPSALPAVDLARIDPQTRAMLQTEFGLDLSKVLPEKPKGASAWRMRTSALMV